MTRAMNTLSYILSTVKMTEWDTITVRSKPNSVYPLLTVFQCLLLFPCFGIKNVWRNHQYGTLSDIIKARKGNLGFGKCQSTTFATQIAAATICCIQYNILSIAKRFSDYETIGGLFREITRETVQLSVTQQI